MLLFEPGTADSDNGHHPAALRLTVNVFAYIKLKSHNEETLEALERAVGEHPEIVQCF